MPANLIICQTTIYFSFSISLFCCIWSYPYVIMKIASGSKAQRICNRMQIMENNEVFELLSSVLKVDLAYESEDHILTAFFAEVSDSPLMQSETLRSKLRKGALAMDAPFLDPEPSGTYFASFRDRNGYLYMGPVCTEPLSSFKRRQLYKSFGFDCEDSRSLPTFSLTETGNMVLLVNAALRHTPVNASELFSLNHMIYQNELELHKEITNLVVKEEEQNEDGAFRHSYHEEQLFMQAVREGNAQDALRIAKDMDSDAGRLSKNVRNHWRYLAIIGITLCARAAITGGLTPGDAYRISGYYIQKCDVSEDPAHLLYFRNRAIEDFCARVLSARSHSHYSGYVGACKDYIRKHYREKIYLDDIARAIGVSPSYLSRLFKKETGVCIQDFINQERADRAANLLVYSDATLSEIAQYVHFPNQSYFGRIFLKCKGMSPGAYRNLYKTAEFQ